MVVVLFALVLVLSSVVVTCCCLICFSLCLSFALAFPFPFFANCVLDLGQWQCSNTGWYRLTLLATATAPPTQRSLLFSYRWQLIVDISMFMFIDRRNVDCRVMQVNIAVAGGAPPTHTHTRTVIVDSWLSIYSMFMFIDRWDASDAIDITRLSRSLYNVIFTLLAFSFFLFFCSQQNPRKHAQKRNYAYVNRHKTSREKKRSNNKICDCVCVCVCVCASCTTCGGNCDRP